MVHEGKDEESIFNAAIQLKKGPEREAYLDKVCGEDSKLRADVEALLQAHEAKNLIDEPIFDIGATLDNSNKFEGPGTVIGRYKLLELIGEGGMGLIYLAEQQEPIRRKVAFKIVKLGMDTKQVIARFEAERQALAVLDHPNIAQVYDAGTTETGRPYFVMEYVKGIAITKYCDERKLNIEQRLRLFEDVCEGVHHAHQKGIIHRDLKPSNILITVHGDKAVAKIIDFGIAKAITRPLTDKTFVTYQGQLLGTPQYMSPEQVDMATQDIDTRSDIYSLGVVLYELLSGALPFDIESFERAGFAEIQHTLRELEPASPSTRLTALGEEAKTIAASRGTQVVALARRLHRELEWIPLKAMRKDRCRRYRSASEMADDIHNYLTGRPLIAGPETAIYRVKKFVHKHAGSVATVLLVAVAIVLGLVISTAMYFRAEDARKSESIARVRAEKAEQATKEKVEELRQAMYVNSIQLADAKHREGNARHVRELLGSCPKDLRGWEWYRLNQIADQSTITLHGHSDSISSIAMSSDGKHVVSSGWDNTIKVWDVSTGTQLLNIPREEGSIITCIALSPDGRKVVAGDNSGQIDVWDLTNSKKVNILKGHEKWVSSIAFSPDESRIVSGSWDGKIIIWDAMTGTKLTTFVSIATASGGISSVAFSPDGKRIASVAFGDSRIKVLDAVTTEELFTLTRQGILDCFISFSPDNKFIASAEDNEVRIWDAINGAEITTLHGHEGWVRSVAFSPDGKRIVSGGADNTVKIWDTATGKNIVTFHGHWSSVSDVVFTPDGRQVISGSWDNTIKVWDVAADRESTEFVGHKEKIYSLAFTPDGKRIVSASQDRVIKVWDVENGAEVLSIPAEGYALTSTLLSPNGKLIASPSFWDNIIKLYDATTGSEKLTLRGHENIVICLAFSPDNRQIASGGLDKTIKVWDLATGEEVITLHGHTKTVVSVAFSPDGKRIASVSSGTIPLTELEFGGEIKVWDKLTGANLTTLKHDTHISNIAFSPDGRKIACGSRKGTIKVWDVGTGEELMVLRGHADLVVCVAFSPDGERIVSASRDRMAKIWDSTTGKELLTLRDYSSDFSLNCVMFSPNGKSIAVGTVPGMIVLWESAVPTEGYKTRQVVKEARKLVDELYQEHSYYYEVINKLESNEMIDESVRKIALQISNSRRDSDILKVSMEVLRLVLSPDKDIEIYQDGLKKIEIMNNLDPNNPLVLTVLGITQYRVGTYQEAINTLTMAEKIWEDFESPTDANIAFIAKAMASHKLGRDEHREDALQRLSDLRKEDSIGGIKESKIFLAEAEEVLSK